MAVAGWAGVYSHLADADAPMMATAKPDALQKSAFGRRSRRWPARGCPQAAATWPNSAGNRAGPSLHYDLVRVGAGPVWPWPCSHLVQRSPLEPAMDVRARVTLIREVPTGVGEATHRFPDPAAESLGGGGDWFTPMGCPGGPFANHA